MVLAVVVVVMFCVHDDDDDKGKASKPEDERFWTMAKLQKTGKVFPAAHTIVSKPP